MNKKVSLVLLVLMALAITAGIAAAAPATDTRPLSLAIGYEQALNLGDIDGLTALFADDGVFVNGIGGAAITGREAIHNVLATQTRPERQFNTVWASMAGNRLTLIVDISDRGVAWGRQTLELTVKDGLIRSIKPIAFRFIY